MTRNILVLEPDDHLWERALDRAQQRHARERSEVISEMMSIHSKLEEIGQRKFLQTPNIGFTVMVVERVIENVTGMMAAIYPSELYSTCSFTPKDLLIKSALELFDEDLERERIAERIKKVKPGMMAALGIIYGEDITPELVAEAERILWGICASEPPAGASMFFINPTESNFTTLGVPRKPELRPNDVLVSIGTSRIRNKIFHLPLEAIIDPDLRSSIEAKLLKQLEEVTI